MFLDAFVNGGLLSEGAQAELNNSYIFLPNLSFPPIVSTFNGFGLVKQAIRGFHGFPDLDLYSHNGNLPGSRCENGVIRRTDPTVAPLTGTFCKNSTGLTYPDTSALLLEFIATIANANPGQP